MQEPFYLQGSPGLAHAVGIEQGRINCLRAGILRVLETRFPGSLHPEVLNAVASEHDGYHLWRWFDRALVATSLAEFRAAMLDRWEPPDQTTAPTA